MFNISLKVDSDFKVWPVRWVLIFDKIEKMSIEKKNLNDIKKVIKVNLKNIELENLYDIDNEVDAEKRVKLKDSISDSVEVKVIKISSIK